MVLPAWRSKLLGLSGGCSEIILCASRLLSILTASYGGIAGSIPIVVRLFFFGSAAGGTGAISTIAGAGSTSTGVTGSSLITVRLRGILSVEPWDGLSAFSPLRRAILDFLLFVVNCCRIVRYFWRALPNSRRPPSFIALNLKTKKSLKGQRKRYVG